MRELSVMEVQEVSGGCWSRIGAAVLFGFMGLPIGMTGGGIAGGSVGGLLGVGVISGLVTMGIGAVLGPVTGVVLGAAIGWDATVKLVTKWADNFIGGLIKQ